jgi:hypothetical protein
MANHYNSADIHDMTMLKSKQKLKNHTGKVIQLWEFSHAKVDGILLPYNVSPTPILA